MVENVIGLHALPLGIAQNFVINGREVLVPMAIEEPSVVAGASFMARWRRPRGFYRPYHRPEMIGQMQISSWKTPLGPLEDLERQDELLELASQD